MLRFDMPYELKPYVNISENLHEQLIDVYYYE
jgi:hypothetical protein